MDMISCPDSGRGLFSIHQPWLTQGRCISACSAPERKRRAWLDDKGYARLSQVIWRIARLINARWLEKSAVNATWELVVITRTWASALICRIFYLIRVGCVSFFFMSTTTRNSFLHTIRIQSGNKICGRNTADKLPGRDTCARIHRKYMAQERDRNSIILALLLPSAASCLKQNTSLEREIPANVRIMLL